MNREEHRKVAINTNMWPGKVKEGKQQEQMFLDTYEAMDKSAMFELDSELQHVIKDVETWEEGLLSDFEREW